MSTLSGSIEGVRGSPVEAHEYLASNVHPGRCQVCAPFLMFVNVACWSVHLRSASVWPVMKSLSAAQRNTAAPTTSCGSSVRLIERA